MVNVTEILSLLLVTSSQMTCMICNISYKLYLTRWDYILKCLFIVLAIILNSKEIHILRKRKNKKPYEKMLLSLSICDLSYEVTDSAFVIATTYSVVQGDDNLSSTLWILWGSFCVLVAMISLLHLIFISIDRVWAITAPFHHRASMTGRKVLVGLILSWTLPHMVIIRFVIQIVYTGTRVDKINYLTKEPTKVLAMIMSGAHIVFLISHTATIITVQRRTNVQKGTNVQNGTTSKTKRNSSQPNQQLNTLIICVGTVLCFVLSSTPFIIAHLITWDTPVWLEMLSYTMFSLNSVLNSAIFLAQYYRYERNNATHLRKLITKSIKMQKQREENVVP